MRMTSRERVLRAIEGKSVDRVPIDFGGFISGIVEGSKNTIAQGPPYGIRALYEYCGIEDYEEPVVCPILSDVANIDERLLERLYADIRHCFIGSYPVEKLPDGNLRDMWGVILKPDGFYTSVPDALAPLRNATTFADIDNYPYWPDPADPIFCEGGVAQAKEYHEKMDKAVTFFPGYACLVFHLYAWLRGFDNWLKDMYTNKKFYRYLADKILEVGLEVLRNVLPKLGRNVDIIIYGDDMGMQTQAFMPVDVYREMVKPWTKIWCREVKTLLPHVKIEYHCCGSVYDLIPDFIDAGLDILNPIQPLANKMEAWRLKKEFGDRICLHGGIDIQKLVSFGTPKEIKHAVKEMITLMEGSRYILAASHNIEPETPPQNIVALYDAVIEYYEGK